MDSPDADRHSAVALGRRALLVGGAALGGAALAGGPGTTIATSSGENDVRALKLLLLVEQTQVAFYREALRRGALRGELLRYARQVAAQEEQHLDLLKRALGGEAGPKPDFEFGQRTRDREAFVAAAAELEDLSVRAYNGRGSEVSRSLLPAAAKIVSVEARHAAWIRSIVGELPAPEATDDTRSPQQVEAGLARLGLRS